jgi:hypothetical protein
VSRQQTYFLKQQQYNTNYPAKLQISPFNHTPPLLPFNHASPASPAEFLLSASPSSEHIQSQMVCTLIVAVQLAPNGEQTHCHVTIVRDFKDSVMCLFLKKCRNLNARLLS